MSEKLKFKQIAVYSGNDPDTEYLYGLTGDGNVYKFDDDSKVWALIPMHT